MNDILIAPALRSRASHLKVNQSFRSSGGRGINEDRARDGDDEDRLRQHWSSRTWRKSHEGNWYLSSDGFDIVVTGKLGVWTVFMQNRKIQRALPGCRTKPEFGDGEARRVDALIWAKQNL